MSIVRAGNYGRGADRRSEGDKKATKEASVESEELSALCTATTPTSSSTTYRGIKRFCFGVKCIHRYPINAHQCNAHQPLPKFRNNHQNRLLPTNILKYEPIPNKLSINYAQHGGERSSGSPSIVASAISRLRQ